MAINAPTKPPDLGQLRGFTPQTLADFHVRNNGNGWEYDTKTATGGKGTRWKSYHSTRPEGHVGRWDKYLWKPSKPDGAIYFYPMAYVLQREIQQANGVLWLVGGDMGVMALWSAGLRNVTCTFGDSGLPRVEDLKAWGVTTLRVIPDRDKSGLGWAIKVRDLLLDQAFEINLDVVALPYNIVEKHGLDINDYWLESDRNPDDFLACLLQLPAWRLPEPEPKNEPLVKFNGGDNSELPDRFIEDVERALGLSGVRSNEREFANRNVRCPFHDDRQASASWNRKTRELKCFGTCQREYLAKEVGERFGLKLADYYEPANVTQRVPVANDAPVAPLVIAPRPSQAAMLRPPLPDFARLTADQEVLGLTGRGWLNSYLAWANEACPLTPDIFHEGMALWLLATTVTRRIRFGWGGIDIYPNLFVLIVGSTSLYRKTTAMQLAKKVLRAANLGPLLLPEDFTPEALFDEFAGIKPANFDSMTEPDQRDWSLGRSVAAQRSICRDECSALFAVMKKDYGASLVELLMQGFDSNDGRMRKTLKSKGHMSVKDLCLSFLGATTPIMLGKYMTDEEQQNGFKARFAILTPDGPPLWRDVDGAVDVPLALVARLKRLFLDVLPWHNGQRPGGSSRLGDIVSPPVATVLAAPEALTVIKSYSKATSFDLIQSGQLSDSVIGNYSRLGTLLIKVAMLLAAIDTEELPIWIEGRHAYAAHAIIERWRESLHRLERDIARSYENIEEKVLTYIRSAGTLGASLRDVKRDCGVKNVKQITDALNMLGDDGVIEKISVKPPGKQGGRPSTHYRLATITPAPVSGEVK